MNSIFYDTLTRNTGYWTIPAPVLSASSYNDDGWRITSSSGYQQIKNNTIIPSENVEVEFTCNGVETTGDYPQPIMVFYNGESRLDVGFSYTKIKNTLDLMGANGTKTNRTLNKGDKITFKYNNGQTQLKVNDETILTYEYTNKTLTGSHVELHTSDNRWCQIKDFIIRTGE